MVELGKYASTVLMSYGVTLGLLAALVRVTFVANARSKARLEEAEARRRED